MTINKTKSNLPDSHKNFMESNSFDIKNPISRLRLAAASSFFGEPQYYIDGVDSKKTVSKTVFNPLDLAHLEANFPTTWKGKNSAQIMESTIDEALSFNAEETLKVAVTLRNEDHIRVTPQVILVRAAHHPSVRGTTLIRKYAPEIIKRADEPATGLAYHINTYGKNAPVPNSLKRAWRTSLAKFNEYQLAKYRLENKQVKTVDVINLVHPQRTEAINKLVRGELKLSSEDTWESMVSSKGSNKQTWTEAVNVMGHMALLRNLRNLYENGVDPNLYCGKLIAGVPTGQQLPFRYVSAYNALGPFGSGKIKDTIEECLRISIANLPRFPGRTAVLCDNSGSAQGTTTSSMGTMKVSTIANLTGIMIAKSSDQGQVGVFGNKLDMFDISSSTGVFDDLEKLERSARSIGGGTENGIWLFLKKAIDEKIVYNNIFVMSDMQAGHGGLYGLNQNDYREYRFNNSNHIDVNHLIKKYRQTVNPDVNVFLIQVAGYQDTLLPGYYNKTYILGGWSDGIIKFAAKMAGII